MVNVFKSIHPSIATQVESILISAALLLLSEYLMTKLTYTVKSIDEFGVAPKSPGKQLRKRKLIPHPHRRKMGTGLNGMQM